MIKKTIKTILKPPYHLYKNIAYNIFLKKEITKLKHIPNSPYPKIFYLGVPEHSNLGDLAQYFCIKKWLKLNYPLNKIYEFGAPTVVSQRHNFLKELSQVLEDKDIILFQSGYTTQDLGGDHDKMHRVILDRFPNSNILTMPQTIFFENEENKLRTAHSLNKGKHHLFLSRDKVSYEQAIKMFPDIKNALFPDIVTTLIGHYSFKNKRNGILICRRNDGEKYYKEEEIIQLKNKLEKITKVYLSDTTITVSYKKIRNELKSYIEGIIEDYSKYKVIITDRYHGTIFSLAANTPVIVIKTTDHKVVTGIDWFKNVYDNHALYADSLEEAYSLAERIINSDIYYKLESYYDKKYNTELKPLFEKVMLNN